jgi:gamma-glutamyltranspeptidase
MSFARVVRQSSAAIATSAILAVVYPHMTSLGGDAFWLIHDGASDEVKYLGGGKAGAGASLAALQDRGLSEIPFAASCLPP